jgi:small ligand-binding sensory domain FIST
MSLGGANLVAASGICRDPVDAASAAAVAAREVSAQLDGRPVDLALVFASGSHLADPESALAAVHELLGPRALIGCGAGGVLGAGHEHEDGSSLVIWAASLGQAGRVTPFAASAGLPGDGSEIEFGGELQPADATILLPDPYTFATEAALAELAEVAPTMPVLGGVASGRAPDGGAVLFLGDAVVREGAVGIRLDGVELLPCVSQGAAPLGPEVTITRAEGNIILELAGRTALQTMERIIAELPPREQALMAGGVLLGLVVDPGKPEFRQGDFLVRGVLGVDRESGAVAIGANVQPGQIVRLHARDARSADADLRDALRLRADALGERPVAGSLVFSCNGRGRGMFGVADHDAASVQAELHGAPSAGFFAAGEIGPVAGRSYLHSFTATIALFPG